MRQLQLITYRYRDNLSEADLRELTKTFKESGPDQGVIAMYERLDGQGGFLVQEVPQDLAADFAETLKYNRWMTFECIPVTTMEDAFPVIERLYG